MTYQNMSGASTITYKEILSRNTIKKYYKEILSHYKEMTVGNVKKLCSFKYTWRILLKIILSDLAKILHLTEIFTHFSYILYNSDHLSSSGFHNV